jgi:hypothetical protein
MKERKRVKGEEKKDEKYKDERIKHKNITMAMFT